MNRRVFLAGLVGATAAAALDPEFLSWRPGAKRIFVMPQSPRFVDIGIVCDIGQFKAGDLIVMGGKGYIVTETPDRRRRSMPSTAADPPPWVIVRPWPDDASVPVGFEPIRPSWSWYRDQSDERLVTLPRIRA